MGPRRASGERPAAVFTRSWSAHELPRSLKDGSPSRSCSFFTAIPATWWVRASSGISTTGVGAYPGIVRWNEIGRVAPLGGPPYLRSRRGLRTRRASPRVLTFPCSLVPAWKGNH